MTAVSAGDVVSVIVRNPRKFWIAGGWVTGSAVGPTGHSMVITGHFADPVTWTEITVKVDFQSYDLLKFLTPFTPWDPVLIPEHDRKIGLSLSGDWGGKPTSFGHVPNDAARPLIMAIFAEVWPKIVSRSLPIAANPRPLDEVTRTLREDFWELLGIRFFTESVLGHPRNPERIELKLNSNGRQVVLTLTSEKRSSLWSISKLEVETRPRTLVEKPIPRGAFDKTFQNIVGHALKLALQRGS
jgi:hypothetical protein